MTRLSAAQQTQMDNRDSAGQFKQKTHAEIDDASEVLGLDENQPRATSGPRLTPEEAETLAEDSMDRARHHEASEVGHWEEVLGWLDDDGEAYDVDEHGQEGLQDYAADADRHNFHVAAKVAFSAPIQATVAKISSGPPVFYDRNGDVVEDPEAHRIYTEFHQDYEHGIPIIPRDLQHRAGGDGERIDASLLDLEAARQESDVHHGGAAALGADARSEEVKAIQQKATLRRITEDDSVFEGDHIHAGSISGNATGAAFDAGANDLQVMTDRGVQTVSGEEAYTDRQRELDEKARA